MDQGHGEIYQQTGNLCRPIAVVKSTNKLGIYIALKLSLPVMKSTNKLGIYVGHIAVVKSTKKRGIYVAL